MNTALADLGLTPFFTQQLTMEEVEGAHLARIIEVQRSHLIACDGTDSWPVTLGSSWFQGTVEERPTVGDWVLLDEQREKAVRLLDRKSLFKRLAAGDRMNVQLIAANVDTVFIVTSCNEEFNESRLERFLTLARDAGVDPVVVLTKADLSDDAEVYRERVRSVGEQLPVELVNALDPQSLDGLLSWVTQGSTVAMIGSSGVGKSTLVNSISGLDLAETGTIREQDAKGRHTTSFRALHRLPSGGLLIDVPGIRELQVAQLDDAVDSAFDDIAALAQHCKFSDCAHLKEPGCAVRQAIGDGTIDERHFANYQKIVREEARNTASLAQQRHRARQFGKTVKQHVEHKRRLGSEEPEP